MTLYCYIKDGGIGAPAALPQNWNNISNFYMLSAAEVAKYGFYPFNPATPPIFNEATQKLVETLVFTGVIVNQTWQVVARSQQEQINWVTARVEAIGNAITPFINTAAARRGYESHVSARTVKDSSNPKWAQEGVEAWAYYDLVWNKFNKLKADVEAGNAVPPTVESWLAALPVLWPEQTPDSGNNTGNGTLG